MLILGQASYFTTQSNVTVYANFEINTIYTQHVHCMIHSNFFCKLLCFLDQKVRLNYNFSNFLLGHL